MTKKVLIVLTSAGEVPSSGRKTGWYLPELADPHGVFVENNYTLTIASPKGGVAPLDESSIAPYANDPYISSFLDTKKALWENTVPLSNFEPAKTADEYDAIFYPGGQGPMFDLATDEQSIALIREFAARGKPVAAVCHGPAAFVNVKFADGTHLLKGKTVTGLTNEEEQAVGFAHEMPFELETELAKVVDSFVKADNIWGEKVISDGGIITGQNPASSKATAEALVAALSA
jgi:putative intracellular protease/amidase